MTPKRIRILGVPLDLVDMSSALAYADSLICQKRGAAVILAINPEKIITLQRDPRMLGVFEKASVLIPDGIGAVWAAKFLLRAKIERVPGADFMQLLCARAAIMGYKVFIFGATEETSIRAVEKLKEEYPGLQVVGRCNGYLQPAAEAGLIEDINMSGAEILFVALGSPLQEKWIAEHSSRLRVRIIQGVGGTLDAIAGHVKRAPRGWQQLNIEWLYRLISDPRRWRRQIKLPQFVALVLREKILGTRSKLI